MPSKPRSNPPTLSSGTVTFLFTDIEGSTRLWATRHDAMWVERAYAQHDPGLISMKVDPLLRSLHDDPRWQPFLKKMGLVG